MDPQDAKEETDHLEGFDTTETSFLIPTLDHVAVQYGAKTHPGRVRTRNEDHYVVIRGKRSRCILSSNIELEDLELPGDEAYTMIVADGAGGEGFGHLASQLAIRTAWESTQAANWLTRFADADSEDIKQYIQSFAKLIQQAFLAYTRKNPSVAGMATTWTCACVTQWDAVVAHVGDSRAYYGSADDFRQITHDHTLAEELLRSGASESNVAAFQNVLTKAFGGKGEEVIPDVHQIRMKDGDALLLCSDGLTAVVDDARISKVVFSHSSPQAACDELVEVALDNGGPDNVTAVLVRIYARPPHKPSDS